jgi:hypothetical protein
VNTVLNRRKCRTFLINREIFKETSVPGNVFPVTLCYITSTVVKVSLSNQRINLLGFSVGSSPKVLSECQKSCCCWKHGPSFSVAKESLLV